MADSKKTLLPCNARLLLVYQNKSGKNSERVVDVKRFEGWPDGHFVGFCHLRQRVRTFTYSGIQEATDIASGEVLAAEQVVQHLMRLYQHSPQRSLDIFIQEHKPVIDVLMYIGYCDGRFAPAERNAVVEWLLQETGVADELADYAKEQVKEWPLPMAMDFDFAALTISRTMPEMKEAVLQQAEEVAAADNKLHENENAALQRLRRIFAV